MANQHETVAEAIKARLQSISGGTNGYAYTPDRVIRVSWFPEDWLPDPTIGNTLYYFCPEREIRYLGPESCSTRGKLEGIIFACQKLVNATENPSATAYAPERWQVADELAADITQAIFTDVTFGFTAIKLVDSQLEVNYAVSVPGWACVEVRFVVEYRTNRPGR